MQNVLMTICKPILRGFGHPCFFNPDNAVTYDPIISARSRFYSAWNITETTIPVSITNVQEYRACSFEDSTTFAQHLYKCRDVLLGRTLLAELIWMLVISLTPIGRRGKHQVN